MVVVKLLTTALALTSLLTTTAYAQEPTPIPGKFGNPLPAAGTLADVFKLPGEGQNVPVKSPKPDQARGTPPGYDNTRKIVTFKNRGLGEALIATLGGLKLLDLPVPNAAVFSLPLGIISGLLSQGPIAAIEDDGAVLPTEQPSLRKLLEFHRGRKLLAESVPYGIQRVQATGLSDAKASNVHVCIIDSNYNSQHPDLQGENILADTSGDLCGHGTHVMGTIAAIGGNGIGVIGVNPHGQVRLSTVKVFSGSNCGYSYSSNIYNAMSVCQSRGANIISMSLGTTQVDSVGESYTQSLFNAGLLLVAAAGNDGSNLYSYPASYTTVVSVAANDQNLQSASFSDYNNQVDISAPGVSVLSTYLNNGYNYLSGTSMATPHVSGVTALVWSRSRSCSNAQIRDALYHTAQDLGPAGRDDDYGNGEIRAVWADTCLQLLGCNCPTATCAAGKGYTCTAALSWNQKLLPGYVLYSSDKSKLLAMQTDGNLVLYRASDYAVYWYQLGTSGTYLIMQGDGNLVTYDSSGAGQWASRTTGVGAVRAVLRNDGVLVVTDPDGNIKWSGTSV